MAEKMQNFAIYTDRNQKDWTSHILEAETELQRASRHAGHDYVPMDVFVNPSRLKKHFQYSSIRDRLSLQIVKNAGKWIWFLAKETESLSNAGIVREQEGGRGYHSSPSSLLIFTLLLAMLLPISVSYATQSGTWTGTSTTSPGGGNTTAGSGDGLVGITLTATIANGGRFETSTDSMGTVNAYSEPTITGAPSLGSRLRWGSSGNGTATVTFTFDRPVTNPVLHIDKIGGSSRPPPYTGNFTSNSALLTLDTSTGLSLTRLSGVGHFNVDESSNTIWRTIGDVLGTSVQFDCRTLATGASGGTACGSVRINGTTSSVTFTISRFADPGGTGTNDLMALAWTFDQDLGDAPQSGTSYGGAVHNILEAADGTPLLYLGTAGPDDENDSQPTPAANGDDNDGNDDEDGVTFSSPAGGGANIIATVSVANTTGSDATLFGWMDVDRDGVFESTERGSVTVPSGGTSAVNLAEWIVSSTVAQAYYSRFRVCSVATQCNTPTGAASDGEVEDYEVEYTPTVVTISEVDLEAVPVSDSLAGLGVDQMDTEALQTLLEAWDPELAEALTGADRTELLEALRDYLDPDHDGQVAILRWETLEERGTVGFYVDRRAGDGAWVRINNDMLPGLITAPLGGEYRLADPQARSGTTYQYQLIEQEASGNIRSYGPYTVEMGP